MQKGVSDHHHVQSMKHRGITDMKGGCIIDRSASSQGKQGSAHNAWKTMHQRIKVPQETSVRVAFLNRNSRI